MKYISKTSYQPQTFEKLFSVYKYTHLYFLPFYNLEKVDSPSINDWQQIITH